MRPLLFGIFFCVCAFAKAYSQEIKPSGKTAIATRITKAPKIDGVLDDPVWQSLPANGDFQMFEPENVGPAPEETRTEFKLAYDDDAFYVAVYLYDDQPALIPKQFSQRDEIFVQADQLAIAINTYNDGQNETRFWATSAGAIGDSRLTPGSQDFGFNAVFTCRVSIDDKGWYAEFKIPYNALRFLESDVQDWSINVYRRLTRQNQTHTWNRIDRSIGRETQYNAPILGIRDINPPVRLTLFPFVQGTNQWQEDTTTTQFTGGMDIKYGLSDSFTLDAQLIPDFGQASFDAVILNLGPFEQTFSENREFFQEGVDLFNRGDIFFSRRIGNAPSGTIALADNEEIVDFPSKVNLLNSIKISGRTQTNLGIGILNSITAPTYVDVRNTETDEIREALAEPLANYNVFVLDQQFGGNSSVSVVNTNVIREGSQFRDANVTAGVFDLANKKNTYRASGRAVVSNVQDIDGLTTGFRSEFDFFKTEGQFRYRVGHDLSNTSFDINDLGLNFRNNFNNFTVGASYQIFEPTKVFNNYRFNLTYRHRRLYDPNVKTGESVSLNWFFATKERFAFGGNFNYNAENRDYFEPRLDGRFVLFEASFGINAFVSSDYRKKFAYDANVNVRDWVDGNLAQRRYNFNLSPRYRFSDKLLLIFNTFYSLHENNYGWVYNTDQEVFLGLRERRTIENSLSLSYNFDPFKAIDVRFRNFWSVADHSSQVYYILNQDGTRSPITTYNTQTQRDPNTNFNIWNLDVSFRWRFAPGSFATLLYRNQIFNSDQQATLGYTESLQNLFEQNINHTLSLRVTYFIDYNNVKGIFKKKGGGLTI